MDPVYGLVFDALVPPGIKEEDVRGFSEVETDPRGAKTRNENATGSIYFEIFEHFFSIDSY